MGQDFVNSIEWSDVRDQFFHGHTRLIHAELDRFDGVGRIHGVVLESIGLHESPQNVKTLSYRRVCGRVKLDKR